ncbi:MAG: leucine-rich repeat protein [Kiritimatiellae bacterium]|nr:leucine-rich repeat protein [Kiritimatiellia bacterium]
MSDGKATVWTVRPSPSGNLEIPSSLSAVQLAAIGDFAFQGCDNLMSVTMPDSIAEIGESAFANCSSLSNVELPIGIGTLSVGANAFEATTIVNIEERSGYELCWTNATGEVVTDPFHSATAVTVSPCWQRALPWNFTEGLVAHYTFDGNANDDSGNGNHGILHGVTLTDDRHGNTAGAYHFDGTSACIEVTDSDSLREVGQTVTLSAWANIDYWDNSWASIMCKGIADTNRQYGIQISNTGYWLVNKYNSSKTNNLTVDQSPKLNSWYHIAMTYTPELVSAYLNGELIGTMTPQGSLIENSEPLCIGVDLPGGDEYLAGDMDEVRIYHRTLSAAEVRALSNGDNPTAVVIGEGTHVYRYDVGDGIGIVQSGIGAVDSSLNIPTTISNKSVISIGRYAFADCHDIEAVAIPPSVAEIGDSAFAGCSNLTQVILSSDIRTVSVGGNAFEAATAVRIEDKPEYEFVGWTNAVGRVISDPFHSASAVTVTPVWQRTETASIDGHTWTFIVSEDGRATIGNGTDVAVDPAPVGDLAIPEEIGGHPVMGIGNQAFSGCEELTSITIPSNLTSVGYGSFEGCTGLTNVIIETESIDCLMPGLMQAKFDTRFDLVSTLDDANDAANVSGIISAYTKATAAPWMFTDPLTGKEYTWNESNTTFAYFGQIYMEAGKTYVFGTHFDDDAYVKVGEMVLVKARYYDGTTKDIYTRSIYNGSYVCTSNGWYNLDIRLSDNSGNKGSWGNTWAEDFGAGYRDDGSTNMAQSGWCSLLDPGDGSLFRCDGARTIFAGCSNIVSVTIPWTLVSRMSSMFPNAYDKLESITLTGDTDAIPEKAFAGCTSLRAIEIPDGIAKIGESAFLNCCSLEALHIPSGMVIVEDGAFSGCTGIRSVVLPLDISCCGLVQAKFDTSNDFESSIMDSVTRANVSGVLMGYAYDTKTATKTFSDPVYGGSYKWNVSNTTFGYSGYMYMVSGRPYVFGKYFDDSVRVIIDGVEVLNNTEHTNFASGSSIPEFTGWHKIDIRVSDTLGGEKGPKGATSGRDDSYWGADMGIGWRDDGITDALPESGWNKLMDPGDGSLFRIEALMTLRDLLPDSYTQVTNVILDVGFSGKIPENCLAGCESLTSVTIPAEITSIGGGAFDGCTSLVNIMLPNGIGTLSLGANVCSGTTTVEIEPINDYFFGGWTNEAGVVVSDPFHSASAVTISPWWRKVVDLSFDANGGTGEMNTQTAIEGNALVLASNAFVRAGYLFQGWSTKANDDALYADGATIPDVPADMDEGTLYAVWKPCTPEITPAEDSVFANAFEIVSISHDGNDVVILYTTDGSDPTEDGREYKGEFAIYESSTIRVVAYGAGRYSDEVCVTLTRTEGLSEAVNLYGYLMETDSSKPWTVVTDVSHDGVSCARSGAIGHGGMTWLQTSMRKAGTVSFWWKAACEEAEEEDGETYWYDYGSFFVDGVEKAKIAGNDTGWRKVEVDVPTGGKHVLRWEYRKDGATSYSPDCIWLDQVQWIPADGSGYTLTTPEPVPYSWLTGYNLGLDSDFETAAKQTTGKVDAKGRAMSVWQDYVAGTDPTNPVDIFHAIITMSNDVPIVTWTPNLNTNGEVRVYTVMGKTNLTDAAWVCPTNAAHRFFKVKVEMP